MRNFICPLCCPLKKKKPRKLLVYKALTIVSAESGGIEISL